MKRNLFFTIAVLIIAGVFFIGTPVSALDFLPNTQSATSSTISNFSTNLYFGMKNNDVTRLQNFLISHNLLGTNLNTGFFGFATFNALRAYQYAVGVPSTGFFGPLTRAALNSGKALNTNPINRGVVATSTTATTTPPTNSTSTASVPPWQSLIRPIILSASPSTGPMGSVIRVLGVGFAGQNSVRFGAHYVQNASSSGGVLTFTVPAYINPCGLNTNCNAAVYPTTPGQYALSIENSGGTSNAFTFMVTASTSVATTTTLVATTTTPTALNLTSIISTIDGSVRVNASFIPASYSTHIVNLRATCPTGVSVSQGLDVCNSAVTMPVIVGPGTYQSAFTFTNTSGLARVVSFIGQTGSLTASTSITISPTVVATSTPPVTVTPPASFVPTISQMIKQRGCELARGTWSLSGPTGTCMFSPGADVNQTRTQEFSCTQWGGTYNSCLSSCSSASATATMCATVCTPGCTNIR